jgi:ribonuclease Z
MKNKHLSSLIALAISFSMLATNSEAAPCMIVTLTGTQGGPSAYGGLAGAGTLVRYGDDRDEGDGCNAVKLQFDAGRGTSMRLSQIPVLANQLHAIFFTHMHSDHVDGLADLLQIRWHFNSTGPKVDIVCSTDAPAGPYTMSCQKLVAHIGDAYRQSGEIAQRSAEDKERLAGGPAAAANVQTFDAKDDAQVVWSRGEVKVSAIRSTHIAGHASYRVDTPAGSVVIGGDAGNDTLAPPRATSTSAQVEKLAKFPGGADIIVHSAIHPVMAPDKGSGFIAANYYRQSAATDLGAMAQRAGAKHLMLTHLIPSIGSPQQGPFKVPGGPLTAADYRQAAEAGGFTGNIVVGTDLVSVRLPAK